MSRLLLPSACMPAHWFAHNWLECKLKLAPARYNQWLFKTQLRPSAHKANTLTKAIYKSLAKDVSCARLGEP